MRKHNGRKYYEGNIYTGVETKKHKIVNFYIGDSRDGGSWDFEKNDDISDLKTQKYLFEAIKRLGLYDYFLFEKDIGKDVIKKIKNNAKKYLLKES